MIIKEPYKVKLELMSNEIENLIEELMRVPKNLYDFLNYDLLIVKLKHSLELDTSSTKKGCGVLIMKIDGKNIHCGEEGFGKIRYCYHCKEIQDSCSTDSAPPKEKSVKEEKG